MDNFTEDDLSGWTDAINSLWNYATREASDGRMAYNAIAMEWSGYGYQDAPGEVITMMIRALEAGYAFALRDMRDGDLDEEIRSWRPDIA